MIFPGREHGTPAAPGCQRPSSWPSAAEKTRGMFQRYAIVDERDLDDAADAYETYLDKKVAEGRKVVSITEAKRTA